MFTEHERHALAYALDMALQHDGHALLWDIIDCPHKISTEFYWAARSLGTMGRLYLEVVEGLA